MITDTARSRVRTRLESYQVDTVTILRGVQGTLDPLTGLVGGLGSATTVYSGQARIKLVNPTGFVALGEGQVPQRQVSVSIPWDVTVPIVDDLVQVVAAQDAPLLVGTTWRVVGVAGGGIWAAVRELSCTAWGHSSYWSGS